MSAFNHRKKTEIWALVSRKKTEHYIKTSLAKDLNLTNREVAHRLNRPHLMDLQTVKRLSAVLDEDVSVLVFHYGCGLGNITMNELLDELKLNPKTCTVSGDALTINKKQLLKRMPA